MTESEFPHFSGLPGEQDATAHSSLVPSSALPGFSSRREMRQAGGYRATETSTPTKQPSSAVVRRSVTSSSRTRDVVRRGVQASTPGGWRRKLSSAGVMAVVFGLFASLTLPAFADQNAPTELEEPAEAQTLEVTAATTDTSASIRDSYGITNAADLRRIYAEAIRQQNLAAYMASGARELGDDYPWPDQLSRNQGGGLSPLNYYYRECVDFVAWRMNRDAGTTSAPWRWVWSNLAQGSAHSWKSEWERKGWPVGSKPVVGAVAYFPGANHVAYVSGILGDGTVVLEEYNWTTDHGYGQRLIPPNGAVYLYAPPG